MKFVIPEQKGKRNNLQHHEEDEVEVSSDEEKYITHRLFSRLNDSIPPLSAHDEGVPVVVFKRKTGATNHTF